MQVRRSSMIDISYLNVGTLHWLRVPPQTWLKSLGSPHLGSWTSRRRTGLKDPFRTKTRRREVRRRRSRDKILSSSVIEPQGASFSQFVKSQIHNMLCKHFCNGWSWVIDIMKNVWCHTICYFFLMITLLIFF